jgi:hypothetical protein
MDDILPEISIKVIPGAAASEFLISSALRAGQPRSLRRLAPANLSTLRADRTITNQGVFDASRRPDNSALRADAFDRSHLILIHLTTLFLASD